MVAWLQSLSVGLLVLLCFSDKLGGRVEGRMDCYVCSWSPKNTVNGSIVQDTCTPTNFRPETAVIVQCEGGCEAVTFRDTVNGEIRHFHRNCATVKADTELYDHCEDTPKLLYERRCECFSSLCNTSGRMIVAKLFVLIDLLALALVTATVL